MANIIPSLVEICVILWLAKHVQKMNLFNFYLILSDPNGTVDFSSEIAISLNFTAEHTENAKAPENRK